MDKWDYKVATLPPHQVEAKLYELGFNGWELVTATQSHRSDAVTLYFKRKLPSRDRDS